MTKRPSTLMCMLGTIAFIYYVAAVGMLLLMAKKWEDLRTWCKGLS